MRLLFVALLLATTVAQAQERTFSTVAVILDTERTALGAYEIDLQFDDERVLLVGVEAGTDFTVPPVYDPKALQGDRIVLAAMDLHAQTARDRVHVATLHVEHPRTLELRPRALRIVAADADGRRIHATLTAPDREDDR